ICLGLSYLVARREARSAASSEGAASAEGAASTAPGRRPLWKLVPWFLVGFILVTAINSLGWIPATVQDGLGATSSFLITAALAGIGLSTGITALRRAGGRPVMLGLLLWVIVALTSLGLQAISG